MRSLFLAAAFVLCGCEETKQSEPNQCLRAELFKVCMQSLPAGPNHTKYNDWDEVVNACRNSAYSMSLRSAAQIPAECKYQ